MKRRINYGRIILWFTLTLATISMAYVASLYIYRAICAIRYPQPLDYGEGPILNQVRLLLQGKNYYKDINTPPYIVGNYPPVFNLLSLLLVPIFGLSFATGRFIAFLSAIATSYVIYRIVFHTTKGRIISILSGLFYLAIDYLYVWGIYMRIDTLSIFFNMLGIYWVMKNEDDYKKLRWSILFFLLALYTRQSMIAGTVAAYLYLLTKNKKVALKLIRDTIIYGAAIFIILTAITKGQFYLHVIKYNNNIFTFRQLWFFLSHEVFTYTVMLIVSLIASIVWLWHPQRRIIALYFIFAFLVQLTAGKVGSMLNYLIEPIGVAGIIAGILIGDALEFASRTKKELILIATAILILLQIGNYYYGPNTLNWGWKPSPPPVKLDEYVENAKGPILAENLGILPAHNKEIYFDPFIFTQLYYQGLWDQNKILKDIEDKKFDLVMLEFNVIYDHYDNSDRWTREMKYDIYNNYVLIDQQANIWVYKPLRF